MLKESPKVAFDWRELFAFLTCLALLLSFFFSAALFSEAVLSPADALLVTRSYEHLARARPSETTSYHSARSIAADSVRSDNPVHFQPGNRLLTDVMTQNDPWMRMVIEQWRGGRIPLWNPWCGCGAPLLGNAQSGVFYPLHLLFLLLPLREAWAVFAVFKLFIAGCGAFLLAYELGLSRPGRWFVGLCFPLTGFLVVWLLYALANVAIWLPWFLWATHRLARSPQVRWVCVLASVAAVTVLGGHPETTTHLFLLGVAFWLWNTKWSDYRRQGHFLLAISIAVLITSIQWLPTSEYLFHSQAWKERSARVTPVLSFRRPELLSVPTLVFPYLYGSYRAGHPHVEKQLGVDNFNEVCGGYVGLIGFLLAIPGCLQQRHRWVHFFIAVNLLSLLLVYRIPIVDNVVRMIPFLKVAHNQRLLLFVSLSTILLGASGLDHWRLLLDSNRKWLRRILLTSLFGGALLFFAAAVVVRTFESRLQSKADSYYGAQAISRGLERHAFQDRADRMVRQCLQFFPRYYLTLGAYLSGIGLVLIVARQITAPPRWVWVVPWALIAANVVDLVLFGKDYNPAIDREHYYPSSKLTELLSEPTAPARVLPMEEEFPACVLASYNIADLRNYDAIEVAAIASYLAPLWQQPGARLTSNSHTTWERVADNLDRLRRTNVHYLVSTFEAPDSLPVELSAAQNGVYLYRLKGASFCWWTNSREAESVGIDGAQSLSPKMHRFQPGEIDVEVSVPEPGWLWLSECQMPGWRVSVNERPTPLLPGPFLAVRVPEGKARIKASYRPSTFMLGAALSGVGVCVLTLLPFMSKSLSECGGAFEQNLKS